MNKTKKEQQSQPDVNEKKEKNAGSGSFNEGSKQESDYKNGAPVSDEEKKTGNPPTPSTKTKK